MVSMLYTVHSSERPVVGGTSSIPGIHWSSFTSFSCFDTSHLILLKTNEFPFYELYNHTIYDNPILIKKKDTL